MEHKSFDHIKQDCAKSDFKLASRMLIEAAIDFTDDPGEESLTELEAAVARYQDAAKAYDPLALYRSVRGD